MMLLLTAWRCYLRGCEGEADRTIDSTTSSQWPINLPNQLRPLLTAHFRVLTSSTTLSSTSYIPPVSIPNTDMEPTKRCADSATSPSKHRRFNTDVPSEALGLVIDSRSKMADVPTDEAQPTDSTTSQQSPSSDEAADEGPQMVHLTQSRLSAEILGKVLRQVDTVRDLGNVRLCDGHTKTSPRVWCMMYGCTICTNSGVSTRRQSPLSSHHDRSAQS
jgi:hypothetical protein